MEDSDTRIVKMYYLKWLAFNTKIMRSLRNRKVCYIHGKKWKPTQQKSLDLDLKDKDFKSAIVNMFKELSETMSKELKESVKLLSYQREYEQA